MITAQNQVFKALSYQFFYTLTPCFSFIYKRRLYLKYFLIHLLNVAFTEVSWEKKKEEVKGPIIRNTENSGSLTPNMVLFRCSVFIPCHFLKGKINYYPNVLQQMNG